MTQIIVTIITGIFTVVGAVVTAVASARSTKNAVTAKLETQQAVMDTKLDGLTREVHEHNNFARRMPVVEEQIKVVNHRLEDLERKVG